MDTAMLLSPQSTQQASPDPQPPQEVTSSDNANLDLKVSLPFFFWEKIILGKKIMF